MQLRVPAAILPNFLDDIQRSRKLQFISMNDPVEMTIEVADPDRLIMVLIRYSDLIEVIAPADVRELVEMSRPNLRDRRFSRADRPGTPSDGRDSGEQKAG